MKVLIINGSPHEKGCTQTALDYVKKNLNERNIETEELNVSDVAVGGCTDCGYCEQEGKCAFDDCVNKAIEMAKDADGFVFATPVHYSSPTGSMISFMDRLFYAGGSVLKYKPAAIVVSTRRSGGTATFDTMIKYPTINQMPLVNADYWPVIHGHASPNDVTEDIEGMHTMETLAKNMAWMLKCIEAGKEAGIVPEKTEKTTWTHFIR